MPGSGDKVLIAGTDGGVYVSFDGGDQWDRVGSNMPYFPVYDIDFNPVTNQIVAATFARGIMTFPLDDLELETSADNLANSEMGNIKVFPTVTSGEITIEIPAHFRKDESLIISIVDINGSIIAQPKLYPTLNQRTKLKVEAAGGFYFLKLKCGQKQVVRKFILQNSTF